MHLRKICNNAVRDTHDVQIPSYLLHRIRDQHRNDHPVKVQVPHPVRPDNTRAVRRFTDSADNLQALPVRIFLHYRCPGSPPQTAESPGQTLSSSPACQIPKPCLPPTPPRCAPVIKSFSSVPMCRSAVLLLRVTLNPEQATHFLRGICRPTI